MSKRSVFTCITPLPAGVSRATVMDTLRDHFAMIDLNPLVIDRKPCEPPAYASPEELHCKWYAITDRIQYLPGGALSGKVTYHGCFHDLDDGLQTHVFAPMGLNIKGKWTLGGSLPGEPRQVAELGVDAPKEGLYLREDVDMRCNIMMASFVKKTLKKSHASLVDRMIAHTSRSVAADPTADLSAQGTSGHPGRGTVPHYASELPDSSMASSSNHPVYQSRHSVPSRPYPSHQPAELPGSD